MQESIYRQNIGQLYMTLVPFLGLIIAFGIGHTSYTIYIPIWLIHACLMVIATWILGRHLFRSHNVYHKQQARAASFFIAPWIFISIFAGMGPLPASPAEWVGTAVEQQIRYSILIICGLLIAFGFILLREISKKTDENFYSLLGSTAVLIATPLFIINMAFWGSFLTESFKIFVSSGSPKRPEWYFPLRELFLSVSIVEVALFYLTTIAFALSLRVTRIFRPIACNVYIIVSFLGLLLSILPSSAPEPFATASFVASIPAIPFIMPYLIGINLLRRIKS